MNARLRQQGLSYLEVILATLLITISLVPAMQALQAGLGGSRQVDALLQRNLKLQQRMTRLQQAPFGTLRDLADAAADPLQAQPEPWSDPAGSRPRILVFLSRFDGDNSDGDNDPFTGTEADILWLRVAEESQTAALETLRHE